MGAGKGPECLTVCYFLFYFQAIIHPDTGKKVLMPFRMSGLFVLFFFFKKIDQFNIVTLSFIHFYSKKIMTSDFLISVSAGYVPFGTVTASFNVYIL